MSDNTYEIKEVIAHQYGKKVESLDDNMDLTADLRGDDFDIIELIAGLEDRFECTIPDSASSKFTTVGSVIKYMNEYMNDLIDR